MFIVNTLGQLGCKRRSRYQVDRREAGLLGKTYVPLLRELQSCRERACDARPRLQRVLGIIGGDRRQEKRQLSTIRVTGEGSGDPGQGVRDAPEVRDCRRVAGTASSARPALPSSTAKQASMSPT